MFGHAKRAENNSFIAQRVKLKRDARVPSVSRTRKKKINARQGARSPEKRLQRPASNTGSGYGCAIADSVCERMTPEDRARHRWIQKTTSKSYLRRDKNVVISSGISQAAKVLGGRQAEAEGWACWNICRSKRVGARWAMHESIAASQKRMVINMARRSPATVITS